MPALPSSACDSGAELALTNTPSTRVMTSPGRTSTAMALSGESGAARTPEVSYTRVTSSPSATRRRLPPRHALGSPTGREGASLRMLTNTCRTESSPRACCSTSLSSLLVEILYTKSRYFSVTAVQSTPCISGS